ncbi:hypothetical protein M3Y95_01229000 [Aphelenchoides besseyi]|nr:hypothetical protein M3Y95_01229000 [Aphelenchoides besseyi]
MIRQIVVFLVQIGSPPQKLYVTHSLLTSHTVFVDINCGQQPQCPRYCRDGEGQVLKEHVLYTKLSIYNHEDDL